MREDCYLEEVFFVIVCKHDILRYRVSKLQGCLWSADVRDWNLGPLPHYIVQQKVIDELGNKGAHEVHRCVEEVKGVGILEVIQLLLDSIQRLFEITVERELYYLIMKLIASDPHFFEWFRRVPEVYYYINDPLFWKILLSINQLSLFSGGVMRPFLTHLNGIGWNLTGEYSHDQIIDCAVLLSAELLQLIYLILVALTEFEVFIDRLELTYSIIIYCGERHRIFSQIIRSGHESCIIPQLIDGLDFSNEGLMSFSRVLLKRGS